MKSQELWFPLPSVAVQESVVSPNGKVVPDAGLHKVAGDDEQVSVATGVGKVTGAPAGPVHSTS